VSFIKRTVKRFRDDDGGFSLLFVASTLVLLLGISAFAVDLGWFFLNGARLQRAADSSALAGVVFLPWDVNNVVNKAVDGADANGYDIGEINGTPVAGGGPDILDWQQLADNKLEVTLTAEVDTFFLKVLGFDQFTMSRTATAQYVKPVPLGAPANCIGIGGSVTSDGLPASAVLGAYAKCNNYTQNFWSAINGRETDKYNGDPYAVACGYNCSGSNPDYDPYYYFAVDVPAGATWVDVFLYDGGFYQRPDLNTETGDSANIVNTASGGTNMTFDLYQPDISPLVPEDNTDHVTCSLGANNLTINSGSNSFTYKNKWARLCRITNVTEGIYVLRVGNGGNSIGGTNQYSLLVDSDNISTAVPRVYSLNEMSIFTNDGGTGNAIVYIAEVNPIHAGKTLILTFFDPGETNGSGNMEVIPPPGVSGINCTWIATDDVSPNNPTSGSSCSINTSSSGNSKFNGEWITMEISIPADYTCSSDCFWKMDLQLQVAHDRTTWEAKVIGNPVALVPNP
jgi:Flp pilus assembly protein TadG